MSRVNMIEIKITPIQLSYINDCFAEMEKPMLCNRESKVTKNILDNLYKKLLKKAINKVGSTDKFKLSLEFFEAHFLERYLLHCIGRVSKYSHAFNTIQSIINDLNQKLA